MKLFVGLGNPGQKYSGNRHNVGFMALDAIADHAALGAWRKRFQGLVCDGELGGERVLLLKPQTYYNEAGNAVREAAKFHKIKVDDIVVFHDEIDLAPGKLRVKVGGGLAGNNGLRSISAHLGPEFTRIRIGVGHPGDKNKVANYVLRDFTKADGPWLDVLLGAIARAADRLAGEETERFQTDVAQAMSDARESVEKSDAAANPSTGSGPRPASAGPARKSASKTAGGANKPTARRAGPPSQLQLAKKAAAAPKTKPSRRIKKGVRTAEAEQEAAASDAATSGNDEGTNTALAARLKRWLTGGSTKT